MSKNRQRPKLLVTSRQFHEECNTILSMFQAVAPHILIVNVLPLLSSLRYIMLFALS